MDRYSATGNQTASTTGNADCIFSLTSTAGAARAYLYDLVIGVPGTSEDKYAQMNLQRTTGTAGVGTAVTPSKLELNAPSSSMTFLSNLTTSETRTASTVLLDITVNTQARFARWVAVEGGEIVIPATTDAGVDLHFTAEDSTLDVYATVFWIE